MQFSKASMTFSAYCACTSYELLSGEFFSLPNAYSSNYILLLSLQALTQAHTDLTGSSFSVAHICKEVIQSVSE